SWEISGGVLKMASGSNGIILHDTAHPDGKPTMVVQANVKLASGDTADLIIAAVDDANHYRARISQGSSNVVISRVDSGTPTTLVTQSSVTWTAGNWYTVSLCIDYEGTITFKRNADITVSAFEQSPTGTMAGLGASD